MITNYVKTTMKYADFKRFFGVTSENNPGNVYYLFDEERTSLCLSYLHKQKMLPIDPIHIKYLGKKINFYIDKDSRRSGGTKWTLSKQMTIESTSAGSKISNLKNVFNAETKTQSYSIDISDSDIENTIIVNTIIGDIQVWRNLDGDKTSWLLIKTYKNNSKTSGKNIGWGKSLIDLKIPNTDISEVYMSFGTEPTNDKEIEISFPVVCTIEDILSSPIYFSLLGEKMFSTVNFFTSSHILLLKQYFTEDKIQNYVGVAGAILKKFLLLSSSSETIVKEELKVINKLSKCFSLFSSMRKTHITILRRIKNVIENFTIREFNILLKAISTYNTKKNFTLKKPKNQATVKIYLNLTEIKDYVSSNEYSLISGDIVGNEIKWGSNITLEKLEADGIKKLLVVLLEHYLKAQDLDPQNYYFFTSKEDILLYLTASLEEVVLQNYDDDIKLITNFGDKEKSFLNQLIVLSGSTSDSIYSSYTNFLSSSYTKLLNVFRDIHGFLGQRYGYNASINFGVVNIDVWLKETFFKRILSSDIQEDLILDYLNDSHFPMHVEDPQIVTSEVEKIIRDNLDYNRIFSEIHLRLTYFNTLFATSFKVFARFVNILRDTSYMILGSDPLQNVNFIQKLVTENVDGLVKQVISSCRFELALNAGVLLDLIKASNPQSSEAYLLPWSIVNGMYLARLFVETDLTQLLNMEALKILYKTNAANINDRYKVNNGLRERIVIDSDEVNDDFMNIFSKNYNYQGDNQSIQTEGSNLFSNSNSGSVRNMVQNIGQGGGQGSRRSGQVNSQNQGMIVEDINNQSNVLQDNFVENPFLNSYNRNNIDINDEGNIMRYNEFNRMMDTNNWFSNNNNRNNIPSRSFVDRDNPNNRNNIPSRSFVDRDNPNNRINSFIKKDNQNQNKTQKITNINPEDEEFKRLQNLKNNINADSAKNFGGLNRTRQSLQESG
jgi:hypothetical protein